MLGRYSGETPTVDATDETVSKRWLGHLHFECWASVHLENPSAFLSLSTDLFPSSRFSIQNSRYTHIGLVYGYLILRRRQTSLLLPCISWGWCTAKAL